MSHWIGKNEQAILCGALGEPTYIPNSPRKYRRLGGPLRVGAGGSVGLCRKGMKAPLKASQNTFS